MFNSSGLSYNQAKLNKQEREWQREFKSCLKLFEVYFALIPLNLISLQASSLGS